MRSAFVHVQDGDIWRVYEALLLERRHLSERLRPNFAKLIYLDSANRLNFIETEEYQERCSAIYYVLAENFAALAADIRADYAARHLWREAIDDVVKLEIGLRVSAEEKR